MNFNCLKTVSFPYSVGIRVSRIYNIILLFTFELHSVFYTNDVNTALHTQTRLCVCMCVCVCVCVCVCMYVYIYIYIYIIVQPFRIINRNQQVHLNCGRLN